MAPLTSGLFFLKSFAPTTSLTRWNPYLDVILPIKKLTLAALLPFVFWKVARSEGGKLLWIASQFLPVGSLPRSLSDSLGKNLRWKEAKNNFDFFYARKIKAKIFVVDLRHISVYG